MPAAPRRRKKGGEMGGRGVCGERHGAGRARRRPGIEKGGERGGCAGGESGTAPAARPLCGGAAAMLTCAGRLHPETIG